MSEPADAAPEQWRRTSPLSFLVTAVMNLRNALLASISRRFTHRATLRYEDFVKAPRRTIAEVSRQLDVPAITGQWNDDAEFIPSVNEHIFAGNPNRVQQGAIKIAADEEWRNAMPAIQQAAVAGMTLPALGFSRLLGARNP